MCSLTPYCNYNVITCCVLSSMVMSQILQRSYRFGFSQVIFWNWMCFWIRRCEITIQIWCTVLADSYWLFYSSNPSNSLFAGNYFSCQNLKILHALCFAYCDICWMCSFTADQSETIRRPSDRCEVTCLCEHWAAKCFVLHKNSG